ncbi:hypothetical protein [Chondromyces apiculatus]|uniref:Lipoprotein n=1 Tax=Chondromyces apiculatus DSM 436 TaxID=1192034 RepID=A0A017T6G6_9BACT|nr:hypothetical protein [Chondromyces apiculatus]EYF04863.1 Hypothetical protein CAP_3889 [Chondromyces apiculatus DSM 436]
MPRIRALVALALALSAATACQSEKASSSAAEPAAEKPGEAQDKEAARALFVRYRDAIANRKGTEAVGVVSAKTIAYFEATRVGALKMSAAELRTQPLMDRLMILILRGRIPRADLERWTGKDLFAVAVDNGWVGDNVSTVEPAEIRINGDEALIGVKAGTEALPAGSGFQAQREAGGWKLDVMSIRDLAEPALEAQLREVDPDLDRAMMALLSVLLKKKVDESIYEPLISAPAPAPGNGTTP